MPGIEEALAEIKLIKTDVDAIPGQLEELQTHFKLELSKRFQEVADLLINITTILSKHPELEQVVKQLQTK